MAEYASGIMANGIVMLLGIVPQSKNCNRASLYELCFLLSLYNSGPCCLCMNSDPCSVRSTCVSTYASHTVTASTVGLTCLADSLHLQKADL